MLNQNIPHTFVVINHQERLKEIETARLYHQLPVNQPGLLQRISHQVKAAGQRMKTHPQPNAVEPC